MKGSCRKTIFISVKTSFDFWMPRLCWHGSIVWLPAFMPTSKAVNNRDVFSTVAVDGSIFWAPKKSHWWDFWQVCTMASMRSGMWGCMKKSSTVCIEDPGFDLFEIGWSVTMVRHCAPWCTGLKTGDLIIDGFQELWLYLKLTRICSHGPIRNCFWNLTDGGSWPAAAYARGSLACSFAARGSDAVNRNYGARSKQFWFAKDGRIGCALLRNSILSRDYCFFSCLVLSGMLGDMF